MYNLTDLTNKIIQVASQFASHTTNEVGTEHILYALTKVESKAKKLLQSHRVTSEVVKEILERFGSTGIPSNVVELTPRVKEMLMIANSVAKKTHSAYISPEHLLVALLSQEDSYAINILVGVLKLNVLDIRNKAIGVLTNAANSSFESNGFVQVGNVKNQENKNNNNTDNVVSDLSQELLDMGSDLTLKAKQGKIDPIIGRDDEIERMIEILCRKTKNNPVLIGEAGVGKTAVVEGLARRIVSGDVPAVLKNKTIYSLDIGGLMAGTKYRGSMEEKLKNAIEIITSNSDIIVFIDEIHTLAQVGSDKGETNPADMLKPYLARGEMQTIGATTTDEYRKYIEKDKALERRFQPILVDQPTVEQTIEILKGLRDTYEAYHNVKISDEAIKAAATLSDRYIQDRSLPDKAIDLIDEASSRAKVKSNYDTAEIKALKAKMEKLEAEKEEAVNQENFERAGKLRDKITEVKEEIARQKSLPVANGQTYEVSEQDIAEVISKWTNIPLTKLTEGEAEKLINLEKLLTERVKGQDEAIEKISKAIRRSRIGIRDPRRPIGSFLFLGPTGVGKTELSKALAEALFDDENKIIRLDMSEFMEAHSVSKLIGSPPGYVGFDDGGQLTEQVRRKPYSVVLFDEVEKAHPEVFNMLLQILDDGRLTDSHGKIVSFKNTIIILTSNIGSGKLNKTNVSLGFGDASSDDDKQQVMMSELKKYFKPELINRIDNIVLFNKLNPQVLKDIAKKMLGDLNKNLKQSGIELKFTQSTLNYLVKNGTNEDFGARPLRRLITSKIEDELADRMLKGEIKKGDHVLVDCKDSKLIFMTKTAE